MWNYNNKLQTYKRIKVYKKSHVGLNHKADLWTLLYIFNLLNQKYVRKTSGIKRFAFTSLFQKCTEITDISPQATSYSQASAIEFHPLNHMKEKMEENKFTFNHILCKQ
jgi:hypothetical protein